jgi:hypothetical protein
MSLIEEIFNNYDYDVIITAKQMNVDENLVKFCKKCGCETFWEHVVDTIDNHICEKEIICEECLTVVNYWSYGHYENHDAIDDEYLEMEKKMIRQKKLNRILK